MFASLLSVAFVLLPVARAAVIQVQVGQNGLNFTPEAVYADPGDQVVFTFHPKNHSIVQSSFASPCGFKDGGFNSGFRPVAPDQHDKLPTVTFDVHDTTATWFYCAQGANSPASHCGAGMVFAINCGPEGAANSFSNFKKAALAVGESLKASASSPASTSTAPSSTTWTAAYGGYTIPPPPTGVHVTQTVTLGSSSWVTSYTSYPNSPAPTPDALEGKTHTVIVGGPGKLLFEPKQIVAKPRDVVVFSFRQKNHTVTQSSFADPCRKLSTNGVTGFDSGFQPVPEGATVFPTFNYTVTDTAPIWAYCRQQNPGSHCGAGMVFAINSDESSPRNYAAFVDLAKRLNGTSALASPPSNSSSAAVNIRVGGTALTLALTIGAVFL